jgi:hypothetical protein
MGAEMRNRLADLTRSFRKCAGGFGAAFLLFGVTVDVAHGQTFTVDGQLTATGLLTASTLKTTGLLTASNGLTVGGVFVIPSTSSAQSNPCTPGQLLIGPGGSDSNGQGGWLFFCRLGGTWATADFGNLSAAPPDPGSPADEVAKLKTEVAQLRLLICGDKPNAPACKKAPQ